MTNEEIRALLDATTEEEWGVNEWDIHSEADHRWICQSRDICRGLLERDNEMRNEVLDGIRRRLEIMVREDLQPTAYTLGYNSAIRRVMQMVDGMKD